jgi:hypothetical protein
VISFYTAEKNFFYELSNGFQSLREFWNPEFFRQILLVMVSRLSVVGIGRCNRRNGRASRRHRRNERAKRIVGRRSRLWRHLRKFRLLRFTTVTTFHYAPRCPTYVYYVPHYGFCYYRLQVTVSTRNLLGQPWTQLSFNARRKKHSWIDQSGGAS